MMRAMQRYMWVIALVSLGAACSDPAASTPDAAIDAAVDAPLAPVFRNPVSLPDAELAMEALKILGADLPSAQQECQDCHGMTR